jgi:membrane fusion protein (multidrug efflux system)
LELMSFDRSLRVLKVEGRARPWLVGVAFLLFAGWGSWLGFAEVPVHASSVDARLEAEAAPHAVQARTAGRVTISRLGLGRQVSEGEVLVELDVTELGREIAAAVARRDGLSSQVKQIQDTLAGERRVLGERERALGLAVAEQRALASKANTEAAAAAVESGRLAKLFEKGVISNAEADAARARAAQLRDEATAQELKVKRLDAELEVERARVARSLLDLEAQAMMLTSQQSATANDVAALEARLEATKIRAPIAGVLGDVQPISAGAFLAEGASVATIVPDGRVRIVAELAEAAAGRVRPGQPARLRLDGFPWTQYGSVPARVERIGTQAREGRLRVELVVLPGVNPAIPLQHGLPGRVDIEVERITPARLALRLAGGWVDPDVHAR